MCKNILLIIFFVFSNQLFSQEVVIDSIIDDLSLNISDTIPIVSSSEVVIMDEDFFMPQLNRNRRIWVYLPKGYKSSNENYPVLYMHDGQNLFRDSSSFAGEWHVDESMDEIVDNGGKPSIVIGIDNGGEYRIDELTPFTNKEYGGGQGSKYVDFIVNTLKPHIDSTYRTKRDRDNTAIMGSSLGGLISFYGILKYKNVFSKAGVLSPSFWFSDRMFFIPQNRPEYEIKIYLLAGDDESDNMVSDIIKMEKSLIKNKYPSSSFHIKIIKGGKHNEKLWSSNFTNAYMWLMK